MLLRFSEKNTPHANCNCYQHVAPTPAPFCIRPSTPFSPHLHARPHPYLLDHAVRSRRKLDLQPFSPTRVKLLSPSTAFPPFPSGFQDICPTPSYSDRIDITGLSISPSHPPLSHPVLSHSILSYAISILSYFILPYIILSHLFIRHPHILVTRTMNVHAKRQIYIAEHGSNTPGS